MKFKNQSEIPLAAFTICTPSYLAHARVLTTSFLKHHQKAPMFVILLGTNRGYFNPLEEKFITIGIGQLKIPEFKEFVFKYDVIGLNTSVKPFAVDYLFTSYKIHK